jgi:hypothetical protein
MATFVNTATTQPANTTAATAANMPSGVQAGHLLLLWVAGKYRTAVVPTPTGWTSITGKIQHSLTTTGTDSGNTFSYLFARIATGSGDQPTVPAPTSTVNSWEFIVEAWAPDSGRTFPTPSSANIPHIIIDDAVTASPLGGTAGSSMATQPTAADGPQLSAFAVTPTDGGTAFNGTAVLSHPGLSGGTVSNRAYVAVPLGADSAAASWTWTGWTGTATGAPTATVALTGSSNHVGSILVLWPKEQGGGSPAHTDTVALSGAGTLATAATPAVPAAAAFGGAGTLAATGTPAAAATATLSGAGTLTAQAAQPTTTAALSGSGTLSTTSIPRTSTTAALSGAGTLTATGTPRPATTATLSGAGTLGATGTPAAPQAAILGGSGTLTTQATPAVARPAALSGAGTLTTTQTPAASTTATLGGTGTLAASAGTAPTAGATLTGSGTLTTSHQPGTTRAVAFTGTGTLTTTSTPGATAAATFTGTGTLTPTTRAGVLGPATMSGAGTLTTTTTAQLAELATLAGEGTLAAIGVGPPPPITVVIVRADRNSTPGGSRTTDYLPDRTHPDRSPRLPDPIARRLP